VKSAREILVGLLFGAAVGFGVASFGSGPFTEVVDAVEPRWAAPLFLVLGLPILLFLAVAAHEVGHLAAGRWAGFRAYLLLVGPVRLERVQDRWRLRFNPHLATWGGLAASAPVDEVGLRARMIRYVAGGPGMSLLLGVAALAGAGILYASGLGGLGLDGVTPASGAALGFISLAVLGGASLVLAVVTLFPGRAGGLYTDGARLLRLVRGGDELPGELALMVLNGHAMGGLRPRDWSGPLLDRACELPVESPMGVVARQMVWLHRHDRVLQGEGSLEAVRPWLERSLEHAGELGELGEGALRMQAAGILAAEWGEVERAESLVGGGRTAPLASPHHLALARGAIHLARGEQAEALASLAEAAEKVGDGLDAGTSAYEAEWIQRLAERARSLPDSGRAPEEDPDREVEG
jgi:hypothetical protein